MSDETTAENALTAEEWATLHFGEGDPGAFLIVQRVGGVLRMRGRGVLYDVERLHAWAALALYGQPFGFTREDVAAALHGAHWAGYGGDPDHIERLRSLAARIAALLPPEG